MPHKLYDGPTRKLVLAFDIGTTHSGVAYAFLDPGEVPEIHSVTKYWDNPLDAGSAKIPSILYYDQNGNFRGVENGTGLQEDKSLLQMRWWKLMLGPTEPSAALKNQMSKELPKGKTITDVFSDFMRYLFDSTKALFLYSDELGELRWHSVSAHIELVLTHPNGWGGPQQSQLRAAAVQAKIVPDTPEGHGRVHFVTEGEAAFHFCATHTQQGETLKHRDKVLIVDAGGGTIDISSYVVTEDSPLRVEELFEPKCLLHGGEFVTARAREMVSEKLKKSRFNTPEDIATFTKRFDEGLKRVFSDDKGAQYVKFRLPRDDDPANGVKGGKLTLKGKDVAGFFDPSIQATVGSIRENFKGILSARSSAFLVGGFASSPWLTNKLNQRLSDLGLKFFKPETHTNRAVAVGAISYYIDCFVKGRISKFAYGVPYFVLYNPSDKGHKKRMYKICIDELGDLRIPGAFQTMLSKGTKVLEDREIRTKMSVVREGAPQRDVAVAIIKYDGGQKDPKWMDVQQDKFEVLCHVAADISGAPYQLGRGRSGRTCYVQMFDVVLLVGLTELKAEIRWFDAATWTEKSSGAVVVYGDLPTKKNVSSFVTSRTVLILLFTVICLVLYIWYK